MKAQIYTAGDYAGIGAENFQAYYGYEVTTDDGEWCFQAKFNDQVITIPTSKLKNDNGDEPKDFLLKGIAWIFEKYKLSL